MSFLTVLEQDATDVENAVVDGAKTVLNYIDKVLVTELLPAVSQALLAAIEKIGEEAVAALLSKVETPDSGS